MDVAALVVLLAVVVEGKFKSRGLGCGSCLPGVTRDAEKEETRDVTLNYLVPEPRSPNYQKVMYNGVSHLLLDH